MRALVQRIKEASVHVKSECISTIKSGILIYLGVAIDDTNQDVEYLSEKISTLRIFPDLNNKMNLSVLDTRESVLVVSQFTLLADARKGRRPSYSYAASPELAVPLYEAFIEKMRSCGLEVKTGVFQASMDVRYTNEGPISILLDSKKTF